MAVAMWTLFLLMSFPCYLSQLHHPDGDVLPAPTGPWNLVSQRRLQPEWGSQGQETPWSDIHRQARQSIVGLNINTALAGLSDLFRSASQALQIPVSHETLFPSHALPHHRFQRCRTPLGQVGRCRFQRFCPLNMDSVQQVESYTCYIQNQYLGICCPEDYVYVEPADGSTVTPSGQGVRPSQGEDGVTPMKLDQGSSEPGRPGNSGIQRPNSGGDEYQRPDGAAGGDQLDGDGRQSTFAPPTAETLDTTTTGESSGSVNPDNSGISSPDQTSGVEGGGVEGRPDQQYESEEGGYRRPSQQGRPDQTEGDFEQGGYPDGYQEPDPYQFGGYGGWGHLHRPHGHHNFRPPHKSRPNPRPTRPNNRPVPVIQSDCGLNMYTRIVGGTASKEKKFIWMAALLTPSDKSSPFCGGTLINKRYVMTAAHCTDGQKPAEIIVRLGEHDFSKARSDSHVDMKVIAIKQHQGYDRTTQQNDISLLKLDKDVQFGESIQPICLPELGKTYAGQQATVAGWGTLSYGGRSSNTLLQVTIPVWENSECYKTFKKNITDLFMCAGTRQGGKDSCQGDSGGPLMLEDSSRRWHVIGVVSWGIRCAEPGLPGVYTRVTKYLNYIKTNTAA